MPRLTPPFRRFIDVFTVCVVVLYAVGCKKKTPPPAPPMVQVVTVAATNLPIFEEWIGTLDGYVNAQIRPQVTGYLLSQNYTEGSHVKKGDLMFQIDPRPFQAVLDQATAKLAQDQAQQGLTALNVKRYIPLAKEQAISQQELDNEVQANLGALAQIKADQAAIETAQINLGYTKITSPIDGIAGIALGQIGDLVSQSGTVLTTVSTIDPMKVYFQVGEAQYLSFWHKLAESPEADQRFPLQLILTDGSVYPEKGKFFFADRNVNANTGTLQIEGVFPNPNSMLRPGGYGRIRAQTETLTNALMIPQRAVNELQGTYQVDLVNETNGIHIQNVSVGQQMGSGWVIQSGLKVGDRVVVEGLQKAHEGTLVNPQPFDPNSGQTNSAAKNAMP